MKTKKRASTKRQLRKGKRIEAQKPLKDASSVSLYGASSTGTHIPKPSI